VGYIRERRILSFKKGWELTKSFLDRSGSGHPRQIGTTSSWQGGAGVIKSEGTGAPPQDEKGGFEVRGRKRGLHVEGGQFLPRYMAAHLAPSRRDGKGRETP